MRCCSVFCWVVRVVCQICVRGLYSLCRSRVQKSGCTASIVFWQHINDICSCRGIWLLFSILKLTSSPPSRDFQALILCNCRKHWAPGNVCCANRTPLFCSHQPHVRRAVVVPTSHSIATTPGSPKLAAQHLSLSWAVRRGSVTSSTHDLLPSMLLAALHTGSTALRAMAIRYFCILFPPRGPRGKLTLILLNPCKQLKGILKRKGPVP